MINRDQNFLVGEWNLEAISGNVRGDVWWHANNARSDENAREEQGDDAFGKLKDTCVDDDEINREQAVGLARLERVLGLTLIHI